MVRMFSLALVMTALALFVGVPAGAQDKDRDPPEQQQAKN